MLSPWLEAFPRTAKPFVEEMDELMGYSLSTVIRDGPSTLLTQTPHAQPAIMATSVLILRVLESEFGFRVAPEPQPPQEEEEEGDAVDDGEEGGGEKRPSPSYFVRPEPPTTSGRRFGGVDVTLGHSLGEFAALVASGNLLFADALWLVAQRARAMAEATQRAVDTYGGEYGMVALVTEPEYLAALVDAVGQFTAGRGSGSGAGGAASGAVLMESGAAAGGGQAVATTANMVLPTQSRGEEAGDPPPIEQVLIANVNSKNQIVLSGNMERIATLVAHVRQFLGHDPRAVRLHTDAPFHSPIMRPAVAVMRRLLAGHSRVAGHETEDIVRFPGTMECVSNVTARPFESRDDLKDLLARQCLETVRWWDGIKYLDQERSVRRWLGIGPGYVGRNLVGKEVGMRGKDTVKGGGVWAITDPTDIDKVLRDLERTENFVNEADEE